MLPLTYFFKVILCSTAFLGYYLIALRNKRFHQYNRFYLLFSVAASWLIPLIKFRIATTEKVQQPIYQAFNYIAESNAAFEFEPNIKIEKSFDWMQLIPIAYVGVALIILIVTLVSLSKIFSIYKKYPRQKTNNITFINTQESRTPFSFFNNIFWNTNIDGNTNTGKQILQHELTHVNEKHSWDKIFMQLNIVLGWFNPCFWLIKSELEMIHEFIADNKAIENADAADFASMLLLATFPTHQYKLSNPFFFSPIKRRLIMLTQNKNPRLSYLRRLIILPLLAIVVLLFAFRKKENTIANSILKKVDFAINADKKTNENDEALSNTTPLNTNLVKKYKIVIDAGHGGTDFGAIGIDGKTYEKDIALAIAKAIKEQNTNDNIEIVLTRDDDHFDNVKVKADFVNTQNADLFISIHCSDAGKSAKASGTEIYVPCPDKSRSFTLASFAFANRVNAFLKNDFKIRDVSIRKPGIWVLQATHCPALLLEAGFLSNKSDIDILTNSKKQRLMANDILRGIETYLPLLEKDKLFRYNDTLKITSARKDTIQVVNLNGDVIETKIETKLSDEDLKKYEALVEKFSPDSKEKISDEERLWLFRTYSKMSFEKKEKASIQFVLPGKIIMKRPTEEQYNNWLKNRPYSTIVIDNKFTIEDDLAKYKNTDFIAYAENIFQNKYEQNQSSNIHSVYIFTNDNFEKERNYYLQKKWIGTTINARVEKLNTLKIKQ